MSSFKSPAVSAQTKPLPDATPAATSSNPTVHQPSLSSPSQQTAAVTSSTPPSAKRGPRGPRKVKKIKDPSAPKRPPTAFMLFCGDERPKVAGELGNVPMTEVAKELGRRWALVDQEVKTGWEEKGKTAKTEYDEAMSNYKPSEEFLIKKADHEQKMVQKKTSKEPGLSLKKSFSHEADDLEDYFSFLAQNWRSTAASNPGISGLQVQTILWERWGKGQLAEKKSAKKSKKETPTGGVPDGAANTVNSARINAEAAFSLFSSQMSLALQKEMDHLNPWEVKEALWAKWQAMGDDERARFQV